MAAAAGGSTSDAAAAATAAGAAPHVAGNGNVGRPAPMTRSPVDQGDDLTDCSPLVAPAPPGAKNNSPAGSSPAADSRSGRPPVFPPSRTWTSAGARAVQDHIAELEIPDMVADVLISEGFDDPSRLALVQDADLKLMGVAGAYRHQIMASLTSPDAAAITSGRTTTAARASERERLEKEEKMVKEQNAVDQQRDDAYEKLKHSMMEAAAMCNESPREYELNIVPREEQHPDDVLDDLLKLTTAEAWERSEFSNQPKLDHEVVIPTHFGSLRSVKVQVHMSLLKIMFMAGVCLGHFGWQQFAYIIIQLLWTYFCMETPVMHARVNPSFFISITVMPLAFAVNSAYARRESALSNLAGMRACGIALFASHRSWRDGAQLPHQFVLEAGNKMRKLFHHMDYYLRFNHSEDQKVHHMMKVYEALDSLYDENEIMRRQGYPPPLITRPVHELQQISSGFERLRIVADYRTPAAIRTYTYFSVLMLNTMLAPYFASVAADGTHRVLCFLYAGLFIAFLQLLLQVQNKLEEPFGNDFDDIRMGMPKAIEIAVAKREKQVAMLTCQGRASVVSRSGAFFTADKVKPD